MKSILLTSTALVMVAGIAAADGHASVSWSGAAKAGVARMGSAEATAAVVKGASVQNLADWHGAGGFGSYDGPITAFPVVPAVNATVAAATGPTAAELANLRKVADRTLRIALTGNPSAAAVTAANAAHALANAEFDFLGGKLATTKADAGDFKAYSEVSTTVTGTVTAGGMTLSTGVSVDAGTGYDFADDDGFDAAKTNGVSLDAVSLDMGTAGKLTLNDDAITHMVDGDDDAAGDVSYTNTFGGATFTAVMDLDKNDLDTPAALAGKANIATAVAAATATKAAVAVGDFIPGSAAVAADVQWSAKVAMPVGAGSVYVAMDEESGNAFGGSAIVSGMTVSIDSKLEALGSDLKSNRANTLGVAMTMGAVTGSFSYDSIKDGNQWSASAGYKAGDMSVAFATNEASSWSVTGGYALGTGASIEAGVNYTEDAFLGLSFAF